MRDAEGIQPDGMGRSYEHYKSTGGRNRIIKVCVLLKCIHLTIESIF